MFLCKTEYAALQGEGKDGIPGTVSVPAANSVYIYSASWPSVSCGMLYGISSCFGTSFNTLIGIAIGTTIDTVREILPGILSAAYIDE